MTPGPKNGGRHKGSAARFAAGSPTSRPQSPDDASCVRAGDPPAGRKAVNERPRPLRAQHSDSFCSDRRPPA